MEIIIVTIISNSITLPQLICVRRYNNRYRSWGKYIASSVAIALLPESGILIKTYLDIFEERERMIYYRKWQASLLCITLFLITICMERSNGQLINTTYNSSKSFHQIYASSQLQTPQHHQPGQSDTHSSGNLLSRRKRYIAFPEGSSFSVSSTRIRHILLHLSHQSRLLADIVCRLHFAKRSVSSAIHRSFISVGPSIGGSLMNCPIKHGLLTIEIVNHSLNSWLSVAIVVTCTIVWNWLSISEFLIDWNFCLYLRMIAICVCVFSSMFVCSMGYNGRGCILRALCESTQYFYKKGLNMVEELVRTLFT